MTTISIVEIQRDLSGYLRRVQAGESLLITDHDRPIAELNPVPPEGHPSIRDHRRDPKVVEFLKARINDAEVPLRWQQEGVAGPSQDCRQSCLKLTEQLFVEHGLLPSKVVASRQEGIYLEYKSPHGGRILGIEVDNELDVVAAISDAHEVLASGPFEGDEAHELLRTFFNGLAASAGDPRAGNS